MLGTQEQRTKGMKRQAQELIDNAYQRGYKAGFEAVKKLIKTDTESRVEELISIGRNEAWEAAKYIFTMDDEEAEKSGFDQIDYYNTTASEAIEKIREYEKKKQEEQKADDEIRVGDEVYLLDENYRSVVTCIYYEIAVCITQNGKYEVNDINDLYKTGRHFPEIENVLGKMQEGE